MRRRHRRLLAVAAALAVHGGVLWLRDDLDDVRERPRVTFAAPDKDNTPIEIVLRAPPPPPPPETPPPTTTTPPPTKTAAADPAPSSSDPAPSSSDPPSSDPPSSSSAPPAPESTANLAPRAPAVGTIIEDAVVGVDAQGPRPSLKALASALDFKPDEDKDQGLSGGTLAAAKAGRALRRDLAFDDVSVGMADDWFRGVQVATLRQFRPQETDLDNPHEVTREKIVSNYLRDPSSWDDVAKAALLPFMQAEQLSSTDPIARLALGNSANLGSVTTSKSRATLIDDLIRRKEAGLSVRYTFEVDVHHDASGAITAIDVLRSEFERALVEKVRIAIERGVADAGAVPLRVARGKAFHSRWLFVATWFIDPPMPRFAGSNSLFAQGPSNDGTAGIPPLMIGSTFDVGSDGIKTQSFDVQMKTDAQLLRVTPMDEP